MSLAVSLSHRFAGFGLEVDFTAPAGLTCLFGRSGSGKTTVINAVAGLFRPDRATVTLDGARLDHLPPHRRNIGYVFQDARLFPHLTVAQNLAYAARIRRRPVTGLDGVVDLLGIAPLMARRPAGLSGGEKQRVAIGRALLSDPRLLLMDEPLAALDDPRKDEILPYIEALRDRARVPILYVSHSVTEVARLATTIAVIDAGRLQAMGPAAEILSDPATAPLFGLREAGAILTARIAGQDPDGLTRLDMPGGTLWLPRVAGPAGQAVRVRIAAQDVILATSRPVGISALNVLAVTIRALRDGEGPGVLVQLDLSGQALLARVTRRSCAALGLAPGQEVFAIVKSVAVAQRDVGESGAVSRG
jgi:molybdate transport system ATP-binding protein